MEKSKTIHVISACLAFALGSGLAHAGDLRVRTEIGAASFVGDETGPENDLGFRRSEKTNASARVMWEGDVGAATAGVHVNLSMAHGSFVELGNLVSTEFAPPTLIDLRHDFIDDERTELVGVLDRAHLTFSTDQLVVTLGRQAITWGGGMMFQPMDIVAPFPPDAIDTAYKPGVEMIYGQYLFDNGSDVQAIYVPRANEYGAAPSREYSTTAVFGSTTLGPLDARALVAQDRGKSVVGFGLGGPLAGAAWNVEWVGLEGENQSYHPFWVANVSNFGTLGDWNISYFAEYYHNPLGVDGNVALDDLPDDLVVRMGYGQVFLPGRDFVGLGGMIQVSPDVSISPTVIISVNDGSYLGRMSLAASLSDSADLFLDVAVPVGADGTEFGGRETTEGSGIFAGVPASATLRFVKHF